MGFGVSLAANQRGKGAMAWPHGWEEGGEKEVWPSPDPNAGRGHELAATGNVGLGNLDRGREGRRQAY